MTMFRVFPVTRSLYIGVDSGNYKPIQRGELGILKVLRPVSRRKGRARNFFNCQGLYIGESWLFFQDPRLIQKGESRISEGKSYRATTRTLLRFARCFDFKLYLKATERGRNFPKSQSLYKGREPEIFSSPNKNLYEGRARNWIKFQSLYMEEELQNNDSDLQTVRDGNFSKSQSLNRYREGGWNFSKS